MSAGKKEMEKEILMLEEQFPRAAKGVAEFSTPLAHQIIAGKDSAQPSSIQSLLPFILGISALRDMTTSRDKITPLSSVG